MAMMAARGNFRNNPKWRRFAEEYLRNGGDIAAAAKAAGVERSRAYRRRHNNPDFLVWLRELTSHAMEAASASANARLSRAVQTGESLEPQLLRTQDQLYRRTDKVKDKMKPDTSIHNHAGVGDKKDAILDKAFELGLLD
jgi:hypothetical protein